jgi:hypothetical protein
VKHLLWTTSLALGVGLAVAATIRAGQAQPAQEVYRLATVDGAPLPVVVEQEDGCSEEVTAATLTLHPEGRWQLESTERETCGSDVREDSDTEEGRYEREGRNLRFLDDDGDDDPDSDDADEIDIDDLEAGAVAGPGLSVRLEGGQTLVFER